MTHKYAEAEKAFITETVIKGFNEAKEGRFAGKNLKSLDALVEELRAEANPPMANFNYVY